MVTCADPLEMRLSDLLILNNSIPLYDQHSYAAEPQYTFDTTEISRKFYDGCVGLV